MTLPDWQLPQGVDRGLWDYLRSEEMVRGYDAQIGSSPLAQADLAFCEEAFPRPGRLLDLGCGTGRLCVHFARKGFDCVGVDLSEEMLRQARQNAAAAGVSVRWVADNLVELQTAADRDFDYAACLFSTLGMIRGVENRRAAVRQVARVLRPGGRFVLHVHNRWFRALGGRRLLSAMVSSLLGRAAAGDVTMPQAYGGAPLTLHHFTRPEVADLLFSAGLRIVECRQVKLSGEMRPAAVRGLPSLGAYGYLWLAERPAEG